MTERALGVLVCGLAAAVVLALGASAAAPSVRGRAPAAEAAMVELVNDARTEHDLAPLEPADDVAEVAYRWSATMAEHHDLEHNPAYPEAICCWSMVTENVAWSEPHPWWRPGDPIERVTSELHEELLVSPGHRANLLDDQVTEIGIGVHVGRDGGVWITHNFRRPRRGAP